MDKSRRIKVFNENAIAYDKFRPKYPKELIQELIKITGLAPNDKILEIGCGTGQLTIDLLKQGYDLLAIEKGEQLAEIAREKIKKIPRGKVVNARFEDWSSNSIFKLIVSAQAFHWIDKEIGIKKILSLIDKKGILALIWNIDQSQNSHFWKATAPVYDKYFPTTNSKQKIGDISHVYQNFLDELDEFEKVNRLEYHWEKTYTKDQYLGLLSTFSDHMTLEKRERDLFFRDIKSILELNDNQVKKCYKTVLLWAQLKSVSL